MRLSHTPRFVLSVLALSSMFLLAACGGGDEESGTIPMPEFENEQPLPEPEIEPGPQPEPEQPVSPPAQVMGLDVGCGFNFCMITWTNPPGDNEHAVIYRNAVDDFATATQVGTSSWIQYSDSDLEDGTTYYYWVAFENTNGVVGPLGNPVHDSTAVSYPQPDPEPELEPEPEPEPEVEPEPGVSRLFFPFGQICAGSCVEIHYRLAELPNQIADDAGQAPNYYQIGSGKRRFHVGVDPQLTLHVGSFGDEDVDTEVKGERGYFDVRHYEVNDGIDEETLAIFLRQSAQLTNSAGDRVVLRFTERPAVSFGGEATPANVNRLVRAVQLVNAALPLEWRLQMPSNVPTEETDDGIYVRFMTDLEYDDPDPKSLGYTQTFWRQDATIQRAVIKVKESYSQDQPVGSGFNIIRAGGERRAVAVLAHELLHALGLGHVPNAFASIMTVAGSLGSSHPSTPQPLSLLYPMDREALRALYGRLDPQDLPTAFGPWDSTSLHLHGNGNHSGFGVALRNGYTEPYAYGYMPNSELANNPNLAGRTTWEGLLLGFTPESLPVAGDAELGVNLDDLTGSADFTNLESWATGEVPGAPGSGTAWGDGDLSYSIAVNGNTFRQIGGDDGILTGAFFGASHEGMGGTLERDDLTAAFGGNR